jgi:hypothetical protein
VGRGVESIGSISASMCLDSRRKLALGGQRLCARAIHLDKQKPRII